MTKAVWIGLLTAGLALLPAGAQCGGAPADDGACARCEAPSLSVAEAEARVAEVRWQLFEMSHTDFVTPPQIARQRARYEACLAHLEQLKRDSATSPAARLAAILATPTGDKVASLAAK